MTRTDSNHVGFVTEFMGQKKQLLPSQLTAALFTKLKITAETALNAVVGRLVYNCNVSHSLEIFAVRSLLPRLEFTFVRLV